MIVRLARTRSAPIDRGATRDDPAGRSRPGDQSERLARAARHVSGLETLIVGWHGAESDGSVDAPLVVVTAWQDVEAMVSAIGRDETGFLRDRLGLGVALDGAETYEVMSRTFASLPVATSVLRIVSMRAPTAATTTLFERLREIQRWLTDHGLIASHVARRVTDDETEAIVIGVWIDRQAIEAATRGRPDQPAFLDEIEPLIDFVEIANYDAMEIAPRLPMAAGPPILILDDARRVVDLTPAAAAALGRTQDQAVGSLIEDLAAPGNREAGEAWRRRFEEPEASGESAWAIPSGGHVMVRWRLRRDAPVRGRHAILIRRRHEPEPTGPELDAALVDAFPPEAPADPPAG